jgi:hypothetical protein
MGQRARRGRGKMKRTRVRGNGFDISAPPRMIRQARAAAAGGGILS